MTEALIGREQLWYGDLPGLCIKTGRPAEGDVRAVFAYLPPWTYLLLFAGILPFFIALLFVPERIAGRVPISRAALDRYHRFTRYLWVGWGLVLAGFGSMVVFERLDLLVLTGLGFATVLVAEVRRGSAWIAARPVRGTPLLEVRRVHPDFAAAVAERATTSS